MLGFAFLISCTSPESDSTSVNVPDSPNSEQDFEQRLTLENATLEQEDDDGQPLWQISAVKAIYSQDREKADLETVSGEVYQNGELVLTVFGEQGEIFQGGKSFFLRRNVKAVDVRSGIELYAQEAQWLPDQGVLVVQQELQGRYESIVMTARKGRYHTEDERLELFWNILGTWQDEALQLQTEYAEWRLPAAQISSDRETEIVQFEPETKEIRERARGDQADVDLDAETAYLTGNVELRSGPEQVTVVTNAMQWRYNAGEVRSDDPVTILDEQDQIEANGNRGTFDINAQIVQLFEGVKAFNRANPAQLLAQTLTWDLLSEQVNAEGDVVYQQDEPVFYVEGDRAIGSLNTNRIQVFGGAQPVVTKIVPQEESP
ncbi:MAG: LPS export ABC transporter periplasmic protein LptC [Cyanobacteria bacterium P01_H01_bin.15]